jgi:uncharacterized protein (TIGR03437 family)
MTSPRSERLEARLASLRDSSLTRLMRRRMPRWQLYTAVTGSALAIASGQSFDSSRNDAILTSVSVAMATRVPGSTPPVVASATQSSAPVISAGGIVPLYGAANIIQPGSWVTIYGQNLANGTAVWNGDFPASLAGTTVTINGKPAYLSMVSPGQINLQAPDDTGSGKVTVIVTTGAGSASSTVALLPYSPSFELRDAVHVTAIIVRSDGSGAYGNGGYDILGPTGNCFGYPSVGAKPGDLVEIFGVGFGPTNPAVPAGKVFAGAAPVTDPLTLYINGVVVTPIFVGMSSAGIYQINLIVPPGLGQGDVPIQGWIGGYSTRQGILFSLASTQATSCLATGGDGGTGDGGYGGDGGGGGDGSGGDGGDGGGGGDGGDGG